MVNSKTAIRMLSLLRNFPFIARSGQLSFAEVFCKSTPRGRKLASRNCGILESYFHILWMSREETRIPGTFKTGNVLYEIESTGSMTTIEAR